MNINVTIVLQCIHVLIAYNILERLLFRPGVRLLEQQDDRRRQGEVIRARQQERIEDIRGEIADQWQRYQQDLKRDIPVHTIARFFSDREQDLVSAKVAPPTEQEKAALQHKLKDIVLDKVLSW
jgi:hypothetical protein